MRALTQRSLAGAFLMTLTATLIGLAGCGRSGPEQPSAGNTPTAPTTPSVPIASGAGDGSFKIGLIMSGPTSDNGWNNGAFKALKAVQKELDLKDSDVAYVDNQTAAGQQEKSLRDFAQKKYNMVFGHGSEYETPAMKMEGDYPSTLFVISSGRQLGKNTMPIVIQLEDGAYLEGMLAAAMSKTGKIASVGAEQSVPLASIFNAYERGAKAIKPNIIVLPPTYTGSWDDVGKAKQQTLALMDQGADVIMQDVDTAAQGVFNAVQERAKAGKTVYALGTNSDQNAAAPDVILASSPIYTDKAFLLIAKAAKAGTLKPNADPLGMKQGIVDFVFNPKLESKIPAEAKKKIEDTRKQITDGSFQVPGLTPDVFRA